MATEAIGLAKDLPAMGVMRAQIDGQDLAIWRSASMKLQAWANRCPHRGMRLSHGFVRGESLACAYHGWHYNCEGLCHYMPAHPELKPPETIKVQVFGVSDSYGVLWASVDSTAKPPLLPDNCTALRSIAMHCNLDHAIDAFKTNQPAIPMASDLMIQLKVGSLSDDLKQLVFRDDENAHRIIVLFQQSGTETINCHVLVDEQLNSEQKITLSRWCESVRRKAEVQG